MVTDEVLKADLTDVEGILNSKLLGNISSNMADLASVTPNSPIDGIDGMGRNNAALSGVSEILSQHGTASYQSTNFINISTNTTYLVYRGT